jgi:hypothetical protein
LPALNHKSDAVTGAIEQAELPARSVVAEGGV